MKLSPDIIKMREALLERIGDKPLKEVAQIVNEILLNETNSKNRLAALAARVTVLRNYINKNYDIKNKSKISELNEKKEILQSTEESLVDSSKDNDESWVRVEMLKSGVVNGVRFPEGVVIDVNKNDADNLVKDKLAKIIDTAENKPEAKEEEKVEAKEEEDLEAKEEEKVEAKEEENLEAKEGEKVEAKEEEKVEAREEKQSKSDKITQENKPDTQQDKKIIKTKSTKITEETIELTDPKAVAEALGLNDKKKKEEEPKEIEEEIDIEAIETGKKK